MSPVSWVIITILKKKINSFRVGFDAKLLYFLPHRITNEKTGSIPTFFFKVLPLLTLIDLFHKNMSIKLITLLHKKARQCTLQKRILPPSMHYPLLVAGPGATVGNRNTNRNGQKTQRITHTLNGSFAGARVYLLSLLPPPPIYSTFHTVAWISPNFLQPVFVDAVAVAVISICMGATTRLFKTRAFSFSRSSGHRVSYFTIIACVQQCSVLVRLVLLPTDRLPLHTST